MSIMTMANMAKILMLNWRDLKNPKAGGAEVLTEGILAELAKRGHEITLFTAEFPEVEAQGKMFGQQGADLDEDVHGDEPAPSYKGESGYKIIRRGGELTVRFLAFWYWLTKFRKQNFDVVIDQIHGLPFFTPLYIFGHSNGTSANRHPTKVFAFIHEVAGEIWFKMYPFPIGLLGFLAERLYFMFYKGVQFLTVSESTKQDLIRVGIAEQRISIIPEAIDNIQSSALPGNPDTIKNNKPTIIYVGRLAPMKQVKQLISAFSIVLNKIPQAQLWIVGRGEPAHVQQLKNAAKLIGSQNNGASDSVSKGIVFYGKVSQQKKYELLASAHLLSSASVKEGFGLVILEAGSMGTPAVVYNVNGFRDAIKPGQTGILCQENTPENLAENIISLLQNPELNQKLSQNVKEYSKQFTFERTANEFDKIISA